jgi:co-chaperonin GroES (HSP10)
MAKELTFKPFGAWIIVPRPDKKKTDAGIILDDETARQLQTNIVEVLAVGPQVTQCTVGDKIMVDPNTEAMLIHIDDVQYLFVNEFQVLGKF